MVGAWERELRARRLRAAAERWDVERERAEAVERARQAAMARQQVVPPTRVVPEVRQAERRSFWDRLPTGTPMVRPVEEQPTVEEFAAQLRPAGQLVSDVLFGPEVESVRPGTQQAGLLERFARTQAGEQEFRTAAERFGEGRPGSGLAWGLLGLAGAVPFFGDIAQGAAGVSRAVRGAEAAGDVARAVPRITVRADDVERVEGMGEHWFRVTDPDNPRGRMTLPGTSGGGRLGGRPMPIEEVPDEIYHVTTNAPGVRGAGVINVSGGANRGAGGTSGSGAVSTTASREVAKTLQSDLRAFAELKNATTEEDVTRIILDAARSQGMDDEALLALGSEITATARAIRGQRPFDPEIHAKGLFDAWQYSRARLGGPRASVIIGDPFSDYWRSVRPENIDIIPVNKSQIPDGALINDYDVGRGGLEEIQVYADIPLAGDVARGAEASRITLTERAIPVEPQTGKSILDDATPGLADGDAVIRGVDEAFRARGQDSLWVPGERIDLEAPGISIGRVTNYDPPYFLRDVQSAGGKPWRDAVNIMKELQGEVVAIDRSYYSVDNRKMLELFEEAADLNDWQPVPAPLMYDPTNSYSGSWFDSPDAEALNAFVQSLYARARSQVWANNALVQQRMLRSISEIDEARRARELISVERARFSYISDLMRDANPIIQTDAYLFDSRITRDGFRNQFQTGTSGGDLDFYNRVIAESAMLGIPPHLGATHRPVYGYIGRIPARGSADIGADFTPRLSDSPESIGAFARHMMSPNQASIEQYGDIGVVFNRSKLSDSTFTLGDSLGAASEGKVVASNAGNITPDSLLTATAEPLSPSSRSNVARYFEWQYVNPSLDDIVAIYMKNDAPYRTVLNALRRAGLSDVEIIVGAR